MLNWQLVLCLVIISILTSYRSYWDEQKNRPKDNSFNLDAWKGLPEGVCVLFYIFFPPRSPLEGWLVWHTAGILLFGFQMFTKQSCKEKAAFLGGEP